MDQPPRLTLRLARFSITNFRTFHARTDIDLTRKTADGTLVVDRMPVFHGDNGSGKSNAFAAIDLFFRAARAWLDWRRKNLGVDASEMEIPRSDQSTEGLYRYSNDLAISERDWPSGIRKPMELEATFEDSALGRLRVEFQQAGHKVLLDLSRVSSKEVAGGPRYIDYAPIEQSEQVALLNRLETPSGANTHPFYWLDARRLEKSPERYPNNSSSPLSDRLISRLHQLTASLAPDDLERWRKFTDVLARFPTLHGRQVSLVRPDERAGHLTELRFEQRRRQVLRHSELSSGEQQVAALCAAMLTSRGSLVAIEEPEISLSQKSQQLLDEVMKELLDIVDQLFIESHVPYFDGPEVIHFERSEAGITTVSRRAPAQNQVVVEQARAKGARDQWVTRDGYTRLPKEMVAALGVEHGGHVWFLPDEQEGRWQAWREEELDHLFGFEGATSEKDR